MARRAIIRGGVRRHIKTDVGQLEQMIQNDYKDFWKQHEDDLEDLATYIQEDAESLVPRKTGALEASIEVRVSKSHRYPGIIAHASAKDKHTHFDYALIQEENESFSHGDESKLSMAHYLGGPFAKNIQQWYEDVMDEPLVLPDNLQHAVDYIESGGQTDAASEGKAYEKEWIKEQE